MEVPVGGRHQLGRIVVRQPGQQQLAGVHAAAADERADQFLVGGQATGFEHVQPGLPAAFLTVDQRAVQIEDGRGEGAAHQLVWVILLSPRGLSGSMPSRRDNASVSSCPGTIRPNGASHSGSGRPGTARLLAAASPGPPPIA